MGVKHVAIIFHLNGGVANSVIDVLWRMEVNSSFSVRSRFGL
jgi:hypothetical protein